MSQISTHRHSNGQYTSRSLYLQRKLSPSPHSIKAEVKQQKYREHLNQVYLRNMNEMKQNHQKIAELTTQRQRLRTLVNNQTKQLSLSQSTLLKEQLRRQMERLGEQIVHLHQMRQKQDEDLTKSRQVYLNSYQMEADSNLRLKDTLQKYQMELQYYRNIIETRQVAMRLLESKIVENRQKIAQKMQYQTKYKEVLATQLL